MRHREHERRPRWGCAYGVVAIAALVLLTSPAWGRAVLDAFPDRIIAAYAPDWLQAQAFEPEEVKLPDIDPTAWPTLAPLPTHNPQTEVSPPTALIPTATAEVTPTVMLPSRVVLESVPPYIPQGWNECGPTQFTAALASMGVTFPLDSAGRPDKTEAVLFTKGTPEDRQVSPGEGIAFANTKGIEGIWRYDGDIELLQQLLAEDFVFLVEMGYQPEGMELWTSHFLVVYGYNRNLEVFYTVDSYNQKYPQIGFEELEYYWDQFNRRYLVFYRPERDSQLQEIIGPELNDQIMYQNGLAHFEENVRLHPDDPFAWFNLGTNLVGLGRYEEAVEAYEQAQVLGLYTVTPKGPWRILWYQFGPFEAYYQTGRYEDLVILANAMLANNEYSEEGYYWKGMGLLGLGDVRNARWNFNQALKQNSHFEPALEVIESLETEN